MSHKTKKYGHASVENVALKKGKEPEPVEPKSINEDTGLFTRIVEGAQEKASGAVDLVSRHWATTAVIGAGSAAAIFLMFTERGQTLTRRTKDLTVDGYDALSEYVINGWDQLKEVVQGTPSTEGTSEKSEMDEKIHQLQERFKSPAA